MANSHPAEADAQAAASESIAVSTVSDGSGSSAAAASDRTRLAPSGGHDLTADQSEPEQPQLRQRPAPVVPLSEQGLAAIRLVLALGAVWLTGWQHMPQWPLPPLLGLASVTLLAVVWVPGIRANPVTRRSGASLFSMLYSLVPAPVQRAVYAAGIATRTCQFVLEPVAAAIAFAAVLNHVR